MNRHVEWANGRSRYQQTIKEIHSNGSFCTKQMRRINHVTKHDTTHTLNWIPRLILLLKFQHRQDTLLQCNPVGSSNIHVIFTPWNTSQRYSFAFWFSCTEICYFKNNYFCPKQRKLLLSCCNDSALALPFSLTFVHQFICFEFCFVRLSVHHSLANEEYSS